MNDSTYWFFWRMRTLRWASLVIAACGAIVLAAVVGYITHPTQQQLFVATPLQAQASPLSKPYLASAAYAADYPALAKHFQTQIYRSYCGVASSVTVLNALGVEVDQRSFFAHNGARARSQLRTFFTGMPLRDLSQLLDAHGVVATVHYGTALSLAEFRQRLLANLANADDFVLINYARETLGQKPGGHISPIAAYDPEQDAALILDVASYKYPPVWVPLDVLFDSINTIDNETGLSRGVVVVRRP
jgi:hypothetical protein